MSLKVGSRWSLTYEQEWYEVVVRECIESDTNGRMYVIVEHVAGPYPPLLGALEAVPQENLLEGWEPFNE